MSFASGCLPQYKDIHTYVSLACQNDLRGLQSRQRTFIPQAIQAIYKTDNHTKTNTMTNTAIQSKDLIWLLKTLFLTCGSDDPDSITYTVIPRLTSDPANEFFG